VGDPTAYQLHFAQSTAVDPVDIEAAIVEVVTKALGLSEANAGDRSKRLVFLWDVVYATLTVVFTDDSKMYDARHVTKCYFPELDKKGTGKALSNQVRQMLNSSMARIHHRLLPATMPVFYSDQDRASVGEKNFKAHQLTNGPS
jgi:hypothetical protein